MTVDYGQLLGGVGLFLFAMSQLEAAIKVFAGRKFRAWLRHYANTPVQAIAVGTFSTAVLQSSSLLGLMLLAFVGAGVMALEAALGVIIGANLGTTFTGWLVTLFGFKLDLDAVALPVVGVGSLLLVAAKGRLAEFGRFVAALGLLLMGLAFMKESVVAIAENFDTAKLAGLSLWQFLLFGVLITAVIQSSSATLMIALTALYGEIVDLKSAAAIAIGADLGTTLTMVIGALPGPPTKKRVALAHVVFNVVTDTIAFLLLVPLLGLVASMGIQDPMLSLVAFHSLFNVIGILLFFPALPLFSRWLSQRFAQADSSEAKYVSEAIDAVPEAAIEAIERESAHLLARVIDQNMRAFTPRLPQPPGACPVPYDDLLPDAGEPFEMLYRKSKRLEGEILSFSIGVKKRELKQQELLRLDQLTSVIRSAVHAAKSLRDIRHNLVEFEESPVREVNAFREHVRSVMTAFYGKLYSLPAPPEADFEDFTKILEEVHVWHDQLHSDILRGVESGKVSDAEISSLLNANREVLNSNVSILMAVKEYHLLPDQSAAFQELSGAA